MTSTWTTGKRTAVTLLVAIGAATIVAPALAAAEDDCEPARSQAFERLHAVDVRVVELAPLGVALSRDIGILGVDAAALADIVDVVDLVDAIDSVHFDRRERGESHPMTRGIAAVAAIAQLPGHLAIGAQHTVEALAKATPRVLRAIF